MNGSADILVVGAGTMARTYVDVCLELGWSPLVVTRGESKAHKINQEYPGIEVITGGLRPYLADHVPPDEAILATPVDTLIPLCRELVGSGVDRILAEKPLALTSEEASELSLEVDDLDSDVYVAFNRRHFTSVEMARERIADAGGVSSFHFDFTEAMFRIDPSKFAQCVKERWGVANSSHVIDMAFSLCGIPEEMAVHQMGKAVSWHPAGSIFYGNGQTSSGTPFTYHSNWGAPGRWRVEINTSREKLLFEPLERLRVQNQGGFEVVEVEGDYKFDKEFKPGVYKQCQRFLNENDEFLLSLEGWYSELKIIERIFGYEISDDV